MKIKGVITGDIIQSTHINPADRNLLLDTIQGIIQCTRKWGREPTGYLSRRQLSNTSGQPHTSIKDYSVDTSWIAG